MVNSEAWNKAREYTPEKLTLAREVLEEVRVGNDVYASVRRHPLPDGGYLPKHILVAVYHDLVDRGEIKTDAQLLARIRMKPIRTLSGVTTVTVLTKPFPCPGKCIFCPDDIRMPKSYVPDEPGAKRAVEHDFDPYAQVAARLQALKAVGHPTDKVELLILGGTWSAYRRDYQEWFVLRCFEALNGADSTTLNQAHAINETSAHRNVGLVIETRPDLVTFKELAWLRYLGVTKVQMGAQSLDDKILALNQRGHTVAQTYQAMDYLRAAGFKVVLHWMPNLFGATLDSDRQDFSRLWENLCPDELKIYPNQLLENTALYAYWQRGEYHPYTTGELVDLIASVKPTIPRYCRVNRIIRDIPSNYVVEGNKRTSLRQDIQKEMALRGTKCQCIRCREVRKHKVDAKDLIYNDLVYQAGKAEEHFLSYDTQDDQLAGFLRLSLPGKESPSTEMEELEGAAIIREVHVYGQSLQVGHEQDGAAQHIGLGTQLIHEAENICQSKGYHQLAVISAIGTRRYYSNRGFKQERYYMLKEI
ncbi:MAG: tRNA uridine(34) 5-carboxymethylaminomethyl modification radical SAM/GNAT enzyme Elp3 [Anaerolineales bacterium]|nr:tRNA uridine(34) 5-carboxymethylaminomethyl modification radical SAM/GNAT enzyme Elp3 [Anaerolineales bacterium]